MRGWGGDVTPFTSSEAFSMANFNSRVDEVNNRIDKVAQIASAAKLTVTTLWTNPDASKKFEETTINLSTSIPSDTKFLVATFIANPVHDYVASGIALYTPNYSTALTGIYRNIGSSVSLTCRVLTFTSDSTVDISKGTSDGSPYNTGMVPLSIYAVE